MRNCDRKRPSVKYLKARIMVASTFKQIFDEIKSIGKESLRPIEAAGGRLSHMKHTHCETENELMDMKYKAS